MQEETPNTISLAAFQSITEAVTQRETSSRSRNKSHTRTRLRSDYDLDARFELALEEFERALRITPDSAEVLCLCARSLMLQARFVDNPTDLQRRAVGLFEAATRCKDLEQHQVLRQWGNSLMDYATQGEKLEWKRTALISDAIELFERGYDTKPDTATFVNPIADDWAQAIATQNQTHPNWNRSSSQRS